MTPGLKAKLEAYTLQTDTQLKRYMSAPGLLEPLAQSMSYS